MNKLETFKKYSGQNETIYEYGFVRFPMPNQVRYFMIFLILLVLAVTWWFCGREVVTVVSGITAFLFAFQQWKEARYELTLDKYYERLNLANTRLENLRNANKDIMYVFTELDNLEYVIEKHKRGYIEPEQAFRALKNFYSHCEHKTDLIDEDDRLKNFRDLAIKWVKKAGYQDSTIKIVERVYDDFR